MILCYVFEVASLKLDYSRENSLCVRARLSINKRDPLRDFQYN